MKKQALAKSAEGLFIKNSRFKTTLISFNFYLPLRKETVAEYALLPFILTTCSEKYPEFSKLNYKLNKLYGARLDASSEKFGDYQLLKMSISVINDRFALDDESLVKRASELLLGLTFEPSVENGSFLKDDLEREKRKCIEHIKGEYSEKRIYAKKRLIEEMFKDDYYGIPKCGEIKDVENVTGESLYKAWRRMLETAFFRVNVVGATVPSGLFEGISEKFNTIDRQQAIEVGGSAPAKAGEKINTVTEKQPVSQGKLVMGFSSEMYGNDEQSLPLLIMGDLFGGGPYSRLFSNVREKLSLCYYCSASTVRQKGLLTVESGVEEKNAQKAQKEILNQLEIIKNGEFEDSLLEYSIKSVCDSFKTFEDSLTSLDTWYALKICNDELYTPEELGQKVSEISREDVIRAANGVKLHTVYKLLPLEAK